VFGIKVTALMKTRQAIAVSVVVVVLAGCDWMPGKPIKSQRPVVPSAIMGFDQLYAHNCSGCHGGDGKLGASLPLNVPVYLKWVGKKNLVRITSEGIAGTTMPAFLDSAGGTLTAQQIESLIDQMLAEWGQPDAAKDAALPAYSGPASAGNPERGAAAYQTFCEHCHGKDGKGGPKGGSIVDGAYLSLIGDQALRTLVVAGRQDLGMPDWRGYVKGRAMTPQEIDDVVAWMTSQRKRFPGQPYADRKPLQ